MPSGARPCSAIHSFRRVTLPAWKFARSRRPVKRPSSRSGSDARRCSTPSSAAMGSVMKRWVDYWRPARDVVFFKREVYQQALTELAPLAGASAPPD